MSSEPTPLTIGNEAYYPGQSGPVEIGAGQLPSGNPVSIVANVYRAAEPGPTVLFLAGVHGDEINGVEIVRRCIRQDTFAGLLRGTVIAVPLLNVYGFNNFSRDVPDGKDVNRSFPGSQSGSLASRIAYALTRNLIPHCDLVIDFHTGGRGTYNYPQIRYSPGDSAAQDAAAAFAPPLILEAKAPLKSLRRTVQKSHDLPVLTYEGGENLRYDAHSIDVGTRGIRNILIDRGMLAGAAAGHPSPAVLGQSSWQRASRAGLFQWTKCSGHAVRRGEPIGFIADPRGMRTDKRILAARDGFIIGHANAAVVSQGDALFHIGS